MFLGFWRYHNANIHLRPKLTLQITKDETEQQHPPCHTWMNEQHAAACCLWWSSQQLAADGICRLLVPSGSPTSLVSVDQEAPDINIESRFHSRHALWFKPCMAFWELLIQSVSHTFQLILYVQCLRMKSRKTCGHFRRVLCNACMNGCTRRVLPGTCACARWN